jgi:hypothetical protein
VRRRIGGLMDKIARREKGESTEYIFLQEMKQG